MIFYILFFMWAVLCLWFTFKLARGEGLERVLDIFLCYKIEESKIKFKIFLGFFCVREINILDINQILPFQKLKEKIKIFLTAEHWERVLLQPRVAINVKSDKGNRWLLLSPGNVDKFIEKVEQQKTA